ncbi:MAG: ATP-dependent DNA helicase Rep [Rhodanobacteraceae bacterium]|jgi:ATP-dependent DNA helicase Rep|nr:MAG: ATP-dependent DNA helicase Rep [Rhodanobacteraceae bacterium]
MLNPQQRAAVEYVDGPLLVLAGAGSGKTRVIVEKIAHLVARGAAPPAKIAAITFTNKAAREMRERVAKRVKGEAAEALSVCTFHALGLKFLQIEHARAGLRRGFSVLDADDSAGIVKELAGAAVKPEQLFQLRSLLSRMKSDGLTPEQALDAARAPRELEAAKTYAAYQKRLAAFNAVDFDDLIRLPVEILQRDEEVRLAWRERIRYLLVDECQDTNAAQYAFLKLLAGERGAFTCVGDDDQSIYAWRGADPGNLDQLARDYPKLRVVKLEQNYRCAQRILRAANALIANNPHAHPKKLWSAHGEGTPIRVLECRDAEHEAERVASQLLHLRGKHALAWSDCALLYRGNHQARALEKALQLARIPYHLTGALSFLDRAEVKDVLAYLRLVANPDDDAAFLRIVNVPRREIGATTLEKLGELAQSKHLSLLTAAHSHAVLQQLAARPAAALAGFVELIDGLQAHARHAGAVDLTEELLRRTRYVEHLAHGVRDEALRERRLGNVRELIGWFRAMDDGRSRANDLAAQLALLSRADKDDGGDAVRLMTLHSAKGLEFRCVHIVGCEDGTLPHEGAIDEGRLDEERRLFYVGLTRAKELLHLSYSVQGRRFGQTFKQKPSRFLDELPASDLHRDGADPEADAQARREAAATHLAKIAAMLG